MKCHDAAPLLSADRDGALTSSQRAELARHLADCAACRQAQAELAAAMSAFQADAARVTVPDADEQWRLLRAQIESQTSVPRRRLAPAAWFTLPLAAAAAIAVALFLGRPAPADNVPLALGSGEFARADFVEVTDPGATPLVYTDRESGWLVVWAVEGATEATPAISG